MAHFSDNTEPRGGLAGAFPELWARFRDAGGVEYLQHWLALQCSLIETTVQGILVLKGGDGAYQPVAVWPDSSGAAEGLVEMCEASVEQRCGLISELPPPPAATAGHPCYAVSYPVFADQELVAVVALEVTAAARSELAHCMEQLQWGVSWLELDRLRGKVARNQRQCSLGELSLDLLAAVVAEERFAAACMVFVTELATRMKCDRVSLGFIRKRHVALEAISHSAGFAKEMNLVRLISGAMEEAVLQGGEVAYPLPPGARLMVTRAHEELSRGQHGESILTIPLHARGRYRGALTLERPSELPFEEADLRLCSGIFALVAPILEARRLNDRPLARAAADSLVTQLERLFGPGRIARKLSVLTLLAAALLLANATGNYRVTAPTTVEPSVRRAVVSPFNGYVNSAAVRAGEVVRKGGVLCTLDGRDLILEQVKWVNQQTQYQRQRQEAVASGEWAKANIIASQLDQGRAQLDLVRNQLRRTALTAPFDGVVVSGDLSQRVGGAVGQGELLFEIAPLNAYRVVLQVDEYRIAEVRAGQRGTMLLPALPGVSFPFVVERITPVSAQKDGKNYFRVEAALTAGSPMLRPGMEGVGKVSIGRRLLVSIWSRDVTDWARMKLWQWWP
ncbi:HlyD family efflux transporter periplasmic adaptor subunit [Geomonas paludis]|uniref:HlyD family efflux transporter periplasmic adaptor subunit n=1 Tax=Geomonas paludis TaxID=2740185 RepID=A0A6V8MTI5_9BACT|nr:HlyD family efflux transporter periplasmic adaptor subunit [Geomonas paludis]UPU37999.1 HlyD family efflux transporter periplasmic adaptor subunit [Geomonas paludis]GFO63476.1 hypothetical protein GMPD_13950 [Geomonas paludis]